MISSQESTYPYKRSARQGRSERTRQWLIEVAAEIFSELGYKSASTRNIAERAQTNLSSIVYYFGSKRELYNAAAEFVGSSISARFRPACNRARKEIMRASLTHEELLGMFTNFVLEIAQIMLDADTAGLWQFIYREQVNPTEALRTICTRCSPMLEVGLEYISRLTERPVKSAETRIQFLVVFSMMEFIWKDRHLVQRIMGWKMFGEEEAHIVENMLRENIHALFASSP